ncbi:phage baseplate assembly protein V [Streptosporangium soli]|nr:phage baseplate assembly protein V [Streptosporangium sp. KLBMP 9127]
MATLFEWGAAREGAGDRPGVSITTGTVTNNLDLLLEGKILVRMAALDQEVWARLAAPGAGNGAGFFYVPRVGDEVLVALAGDEATDAFVIGGLWNDRDRVPVTDPVTALATRVLRSGVTAGTGHEIELDDLLQSVTITTSTKQKITMNPAKIELSNLAGTVSISLDNATQTVSITAAAGIKLEAPRISLRGATVEIDGTATTTVKSAGICNVTAPLVKIN